MTKQHKVIAFLNQLDAYISVKIAASQRHDTVYIPALQKARVELEATLQELIN